MKRTGIVVGIALVIVAMAAATLTLTGRLWWRSSRYSVVVNGSNAGMTTYSGKHVLLVDTGATQRESYVVYPSLHELGVAVHGRFVRLPGCVLSLDKPATYIPIGKSEVPVLTKFEVDRVTFRGVQGEEITVRW
jgi:hypothetical protein